MNYYDIEINEVLKAVHSHADGLNSGEAANRIRQFGKNVLEEKERISPLRIFARQFNSPVIWILLVALAISFAIGEIVDAMVILTILILNAFLGFLQEYKAEKEIAALKELSGHKAIVIRDEKEQMIDASDLVPGDIMLIREGDKVAADARIIDSVRLEAQESLLTGESLSINKITGTLSRDKEVADQTNMLFAGTTVTKGKGKTVVVNTGMTTEIGKIAGLIHTTQQQQTPLQEKLGRLGGLLSLMTIVICAIVFLAGLYEGADPIGIFTIAVALAVAAIPEGLPAVVTITLAVGLGRMAQKHVLIRKLPSVETLGGTTVICSDKTGTLTHNEMTVTRLYVDGNVTEVTGAGYAPEGTFSARTVNLDRLLEMGALCNDARIQGQECIGDPTEGALIVSALKADFGQNRLSGLYPRINEIPFSSERKRMTTLHKKGDGYVAYMKGAAEVVLDCCRRYLLGHATLSLLPKERYRILRQTLEFSDQALRVLAFAYKDIEDPQTFDEADESGFIFVGLQGMIDPPRSEVKNAIKKCCQAGIRVIMITGDHEHTAAAIGKEIGINGNSMSGKRLDGLDEKTFDEIVQTVSIYARVNPVHKYRIVKALQKKGHVVAMTGDGVNDAPALKKADIGIAMGNSGTDVSQEAADMVLTDDNFESIVNAVEEGRGVYGNIRKFFAFLLSGNIGEVAVIFILMLLGFSAPLTATQILLINLVTDGLPATALSVDPFEPGAMRQKPRKRGEFIQHGLGNFLVIYPILMTVVAVSLFVIEMNQTGNIEKARTAAFLSIVFFELFQAFAARSTIFPSLEIGILKNKYLMGATLISFIVVLATIYVPIMNSLFGTARLETAKFLGILLLSSTGFVYLEMSKYTSSRKRRLLP